MKIECINGFFIFTELEAGQVSDFMNYSGLTLVKWGDAYTFEGLENVPEYSIAGTPFLNLVATETYQGEPWDLFDQNQLCFDFLLGLMVPFLSVNKLIKLTTAGNKYISNGLILPGSILPNGKKVKSYSGFFSRPSLNFTYSEVESV